MFSPAGTDMSFGQSKFFSFSLFSGILYLKIYSEIRQKFIRKFSFHATPSTTKWQ